MPGARLGCKRLAWIVAMAAGTLGVGLGSSARLTYHEAFVAQGAREMLASGALLAPTIGGRPWLEKPPLIWWLVALSGKVAGGVGETAARVPSALAATALTLGVATLAARRLGPTAGLLAGLVQASTSWTLMRGRLAEADMLLACLVTWTMVAFERSRDEPEGRRPWLWAAFAGLGLMSLAKGIGFGAALVGASVLLVLLWDRDRETCRRLANWRGWALAAVISLAWPALVALRYPSALGLWALHVTDRFASRPEHFAGGPWWQYAPALLVQSLPWTPLALAGAWPSLTRAFSNRGRGGIDRLLWAWAVAPVALLSMATVKNGHYAIHALPPWSIWAALGLLRLGERLLRRGWPPDRVLRLARFGFAGLGLAIGVGFALLGPRVDRRGVEWAFYEETARSLRPGEPLALLYDDWDRAPYPTPFGPVPHDLAVRLYYLGRPAGWRSDVAELAAGPPGAPREPFAVIGRDRDLPGLRKLGRVVTVARGPDVRFDRTYSLFRVTPRDPDAPPEWIALEPR